MPNVQISANTVRPDYPADTNSLSQYFSHIKSWARTMGASDFLPPTRTHFEKFERDFLCRPTGYRRTRRSGAMITSEIVFPAGGDTAESLTIVKEHLRAQNYGNFCRINNYSVGRCIENPTTNYSGTSFKYGQLGILLVQHALNIYATMRQAVPQSTLRRGAHPDQKISFICTQENARFNRMDTAFHGRTVLYLKEQTIKDILLLLKDAQDTNSWMRFWEEIFALYDGLVTYRIRTSDSRNLVTNGQPTTPTVADTTSTVHLQQAPRPARRVERGGYRGPEIPAPTANISRQDVMNSDSFRSSLRVEYTQRETRDDLELPIDFIAGFINLNYGNMPQNVQEALKESLMKHLKPAYEMIMGHVIGAEEVEAAVESEEGLEV